MTDTNYKNNLGQAVYKVEIDSTYTGLVFSNGKKEQGAEQTVEISDFKDGTAYYLRMTKILINITMLIHGLILRVIKK